MCPARRGASIDLVLDRGRQQRSQFVFTKARGRKVIFWQSARTTKEARPSVSVLPHRADRVRRDPPLAQEWTYRFLGAALAHHGEHELAAAPVDRLPAAPPLPPVEPTSADVRAWAVANGIDVPGGGRLRPEVWAAFREAHQA